MRRIVLFVLSGLLAALLLVQAAYSLRWPIAHDEAPLLYEGFLMHVDGRLPYRDLFDFQMPGSFMAYYLLGRLSGFTAFRLRVIDLLILVVLLVITYAFMKRFGRMAALAAALLFGLKYMQGGAYMALQREYLLLVFVTFAVWMTLRGTLTPKQRILIGLCFGLAAVIKPHAALGLLSILLFDITDISKRLNISLFQAALQSGLALGIGFAVPVAGVLFWLVITGAFKPFLDIALNYWPLYSQINGQMEITPQAGRLSFLVLQTLRLGEHGIWLVPAAVGMTLLPRSQRREGWLLAGFALCYAVYPALSGQFFEYHYIPFMYFIVLLASLALADAETKWQNWALVVLIAVTALNVRPSSTFMRQLEDRTLSRTTDRAGSIARFLNKNLQKGDTVQPLDWTGGTLLAMLETRAHLATPYVFDFYFYHHVSDLYIRSLRADFMTELSAARPRFIVEVTAVDKPWVSGADTSREFPELRAFLEENYSITIQREDYIIYELR